MSAPNTVTIQNNSGDNFSSAIIFHASGTIVAPLPVDLDVVLEFNTPLNNGGTSPSGTATVVDGLSDWWFGALMNSSNKEVYYISSDAVADIPFKECASPDNGSTVFQIGPDSGSGYEVTIQTINSDGSSDGSCSAVAASESEIGDSWVAFAATVGAGLLKGILKALTEIDAQAQVEESPESKYQNGVQKITAPNNSVITITNTTKIVIEPITN